MNELKILLENDLIITIKQNKVIISMLFGK